MYMEERDGARETERQTQTQRARERDAWRQRSFGSFLFSTQTRFLLLFPRSTTPFFRCGHGDVRVLCVCRCYRCVQVERVFRVEEDDIVDAMRLVYERMKLVIEPSAGTGIAVALSEVFKRDVAEAEGSTVQRVGIILCGGNVDLDNLPWKKE